VKLSGAICLPRRRARPRSNAAGAAARRQRSSSDNVLTYGMGYHQQRYSPLKQINKSTVKHLRPASGASRLRTKSASRPSLSGTTA